MNDMADSLPRSVTMNNADILKKIIEFADHAHGQQMRKYSTDRYIVHPVRVMKTCSHYTESVPVLSAALLHDVVEDTNTTLYDIKNFLSVLMNDEEADTIITLVRELTDVYVKKAFPNLNRFKRKKKELKRLCTISPDAQTIKYADIIDNAKDISKSGTDFAKRYLQECYDIVSALKKGNPELRSVALEVIFKEQQKHKHI